LTSALALTDDGLLKAHNNLHCCASHSPPILIGPPQFCTEQALELGVDERPDFGERDEIKNQNAETGNLMAGL
jgi:hypothetical protein